MFRLDHGDGISSDYFNDRNDNKMDEDSTVLHEAEEFVHMMEVECITLKTYPTTPFLQDCMDGWTHTEIVIQD